MYNETLRRSSYSGHEERTAKTRVPSNKHEHAAPKSHRSRPKSSGSPAHCDGLKVLDPLVVQQAGERIIVEMLLRAMARQSDDVGDDDNEKENSPVNKRLRC